MLIKYDDLPLQQTPESLAYVATSDRNAYGRYWFNGYDPDGEFYFGVAVGIYPNRDVMDCALSIVRKDGTQDSFRASRRCPADRSDTRIGPFTLQIPELMRTVRITLEDNSTGITADLTFHARTAAHEEPTDLMRVGSRVIMHTKRYTQFGMWGGHISVKGRRQEVDRARVQGVRDRSWGWRWVGEPEGGGSTGMPPQVFWLWAPIHWRDRCTHYGLWESSSGKRVKEFAHIFPAHPIEQPFDTLDESGIREIVAGPHCFQFERGSRFVASGTIDLIEGERSSTLQLEVLLRFHMIGIGYNHPDWGHGMWKGEEALTSEHWKVEDLDRVAPKNQHVQQVVRVSKGGEIGHGVLEQLFYGEFQQYGMKGLLDPL